MEQPVSAFLRFIATCLLGSGIATMLREHTYTSVPAWIVIVVGVCLFFVGYYWEKIGPRIGEKFAASATKIASDFRYWLAVIALLWAYMAVPDVITAVLGTTETQASIRLLKTQMEHYVLPRHLTQKKMSLIANYLNSFDSHEVVMIVASNDGEASDYSADLRTALQKAGWRIASLDYKNEVPVGLSLNFQQSMESSGKPQDPRRPTPMMLLTQAFGQFGVEVDNSGGGSGIGQKEDVLTISVGKRPTDITTQFP